MSRVGGMMLRSGFAFGGFFFGTTVGSSFFISFSFSVLFSVTCNAVFVTPAFFRSRHSFVRCRPGLGGTLLKLSKNPGKTRSSPVSSMYPARTIVMPKPSIPTIMSIMSKVAPFRTQSPFSWGIPRCLICPHVTQSPPIVTRRNASFVTFPLRSKSPPLGAISITIPSTFG